MIDEGVPRIERHPLTCCVASFAADLPATAVPTLDYDPVDPNDHWFATDHLKGNLRQRTVNAGMVMA